MSHCMEVWALVMRPHELKRTSGALQLIVMATILLQLLSRGSDVEAYMKHKEFQTYPMTLVGDIR